MLLVLQDLTFIWVIVQVADSCTQQNSKKWTWKLLKTFKGKWRLLCPSKIWEVSDQQILPHQLYKTIIVLFMFKKY